MKTIDLDLNPYDSSHISDDECMRIYNMKTPSKLRLHYTQVFVDRVLFAHNLYTQTPMLLNCEFLNKTVNHHDISYIELLDENDDVLEPHMYIDFETETEKPTFPTYSKHMFTFVVNINGVQLFVGYTCASCMNVEFAFTLKLKDICDTQN